MERPRYDLILGHIPGMQAVNDPNPDWGAHKEDSIGEGDSPTAFVYMNFLTLHATAEQGVLEVLCIHRRYGDVSGTPEHVTKSAILSYVWLTTPDQTHSVPVVTERQNLGVGFTNEGHGRIGGPKTLPCYKSALLRHTGGKSLHFCSQNWSTAVPSGSPSRPIHGVPRVHSDERRMPSCTVTYLKYHPNGTID